MKRLDKHLLISFVGPFFLILLVVIFILVMQTLWLYIDELVGKGLGFRVIAEFLFWGSCTILPLALLPVQLLFPWTARPHLLIVQNSGVVFS